MTSIDSHCTTCGVPLTGPVCAVCGGNAEVLPLADGDGNLPRFGIEAGKPELEWAHEAWARGEHARVVSHCLAAEGAQGIKNISLPEGPAFIALVGGMSVIIRVRPKQEQIVIETPVARLPETQYVGAMRLALELSGGSRSAARYAVRADLLVLRMVGRIDVMSPHVIQSALKSIVAQAADDARVMSTSVHARVLGTDEHVNMDLDKLPEAPVLDLDPQPGASSGGGAQAAVGAPRAAAPAAPPAAPKSTGLSGMFQSVAPILGADGPSSPPRPPAPEPAAPQAAPPRAAPPAAAKAPAPAASPAARPLGLAPPPAPDRKPVPASASPTSQALTKPGPPRPPPPKASPPTVRSKEQGGQADPNRIGTPTPAVGVLQLPEAQRSTPSAPAVSPADGLVNLLHKAQTIGAVLSFADLPASMMLLIRAAVYRAVFDHETLAPSAVAYLFNETAALTKEIYITAPGKRRGAMAIPSPQPAFDVMQTIVDTRGEVPGKNTMQVTPITTSQEAKQHLARYLSEIDQMPQDLELRHFLTLGALSELLVRTKLPGPTQDRLKGIVALAEREGANQQNVELMMTALSRMIA